MKSFILLPGVLLSALLFLSCTGTTKDDDTNSAPVYSPAVYKQSTNEMLILTLNLHTYQESDQQTKLNLIAKVINDLDVDFIAFEECAQNKNSTLVSNGIRVDNMALIITDKLKTLYSKTYYYTWTWAHYGWDVWEEGIAVVSRYPFENTDSRYVSADTSTTSILSRKAIYGRVSTSAFGAVHFFTTHIHWRTSETDTEQNNQINNIKTMVTEKEDAYTGSEVTFVCGDFNMQPTDTPPWNGGYLTMTTNGVYQDTFLIYNPHANDLPENSVYDTIKGDYPGRIDYIFMKTNSTMEVAYSEILFTPSYIGVVSDHYGVITRLKKK